MLTHLLYLAPIIVTVRLTWWALGLKEENQKLKVKLANRH